MRKVGIFGVPTALGQPHKGVSLGPDALRSAGLIRGIRGLDRQVQDYGNLAIPIQNEDTLAPVVATSEKLYHFLLQQLATQAMIPLILGGDHSLSIGSIAALAEVHKNLGVVWFDAHPDLNTPETSPSGNVHGMSLAVLLGEGDSRLVSLGSMQPKVKAENVVIIGARAIDCGESDFIERRGIKVFSMNDIKQRGIGAVLKQTIAYLAPKTNSVHLSFDLDGLDPQEAPGVGTPAPGGLSFADASTVMKLLNQSNLVTSCEIVELNPSFDIGNQTALKAVELVLTLLGKTQSHALEA